MWNNVRWVNLPYSLFNDSGAQRDFLSNWTPLTAPPYSAIRLHCEQVHDVPVKNDNFSITDSTENKVSLRILESLYIQKLKPELTDTNSAFSLNIV